MLSGSGGGLSTTSGTIEEFEERKDGLAGCFCVVVTL